MINSITIKNYKSVINVNLPLGRFNVLIGANGCGKSNILEGIAMGAAASSDKLDYEYFSNRGIRVTAPNNMLPAFENVKAEKITIGLTNGDNSNAAFDIVYNKDLKPDRWIDKSVKAETFVNYINKNKSKHNETITALVEKLSNFIKEKKSDGKNIRLKESTEEGKVDFMEVDADLSPFLIYSIEESKLRELNNSNRIYPLGRQGEGLFAYLKDLSQDPKGEKIFKEIKQNLKVLDWFDDMEAPTGQLSMEYDLKLKDSYLPELYTFDQRSTNEGFLYLLFYFTLVISDETPRFFAIENIDTALNPKLCREVIKQLVALAKKYDKQIIATTHNPSVLDGMDLYDDEQKLMVVQRSIDGYTKIRTIKKEEVTNSEKSLSQLWLSGYIGGLPNNF